MKSRSKMLPDLSVQRPSFWSKPRASIASKSCLASSLSGSLKCTLKLIHTIRFVPLSEYSSIAKVSINSVMNCPMVCWNLSDGGGWYNPKTFMVLESVDIDQSQYSNVFIVALSTNFTLRFSLYISEIPLPFKQFDQLHVLILSNQY